jgi:hypothetical protein
MAVIRDTSPIPRSYQKNISFPLYYPHTLPTGYTVDKKSFEQPDTGVLTYSIIAPNGRRIAVSETATPAHRPDHKKVPKLLQIPGEDVYDIPIGSVRISAWDKQYVSDILTDDTWIILNVTGFTFEEAKTVTNSFTEL